jgi:hypothetical protein
MIHPHLHLPHPLGHDHDHALALTAAAVAATVVVSVGAARMIEDGAPLAAPTTTEQTADAAASTAVPAQAPEATAAPATSAAPISPAPASAQVVVVDVPDGMLVSRAWLVTGSGAEVPATMVGPAEVRFDGLAAGVYTIGYQVETGASHAGDGAVISAARAGWMPPVTVVDGASIVVSFSHRD